MIPVDVDAIQYAFQAYEQHRKKPDADACSPVHAVITAYLDALAHQGYVLVKRLEESQ